MLNFLQRSNLTLNQLEQINNELLQLSEDKSLSNVYELSNFEGVDILSSSDGFIDKIINLDSSTYYSTILLDIIKNKESFSLDIFQLFENYLSKRFQNIKTLEEKQDFLNNLH